MGRLRGGHFLSLFRYVAMPAVCGRPIIANGDRLMIFVSLINVRELGFRQNSHFRDQVMMKSFCLSR